MARAFMTGMIIATMMLAQGVRADTYLYAGAWSDHPFSEGEYNETHNLAAIEYGSVVAGYFVNSYGEDSFVTGYRFKRAWGDLEASLLVGASYGYRSCLKGWADHPRRVCPVAVPMISYTKYRVEPSVLVLGNAVAFSLRIEL